MNCLLNETSMLFGGMAGAVALFTRDGKKMNRRHSNCQKLLPLLDF